MIPFEDDPLAYETRKAQRRYCARLKYLQAWGWLVMQGESLTGGLWRAVTWSLFFVGLWLLDVPALFGVAGIYGAPIVFFAGLAGFLIADMSRIRPVTPKRILRRIEEESGLVHRPLSAMSESLANPENPETRALWRKREARLVAALDMARLPVPRPVLPVRDPAGLRFIALLCLVCGVVVTGSSLWQTRLWTGLFPFTPFLASRTTPDVRLWIVPPAYTNQPESLLTGIAERNAEPLPIPQGSMLKLRSNGGLPLPPVLVMGGDILPMERIGRTGRTYALDVPVAQGDHLVVRQAFLSRLRVPYTLKADMPPVVRLTGKPEIMAHGQIRLPVQVRDDYGVQDIEMHMTLDPVVDDPPTGADVKDVRTVMSPPETDMDLYPIYDLAAHPWAGLPAQITLQAVDTGGQSSEIETLSLTLPERIFTHPVAQEIIALRKRLIWENQETVSAPEIARALDRLSAAPHTYRGDPITFLALRTATYRLLYAPDPQTVRALIDLLWNTALRIEDGNLSLSARKLREAQQKLESALTQGASESEIAELMDALRQAMAEYFYELGTELGRRMDSGENMLMIPPEMIDQVIDGETLLSLLDQLNAELMGGDPARARELLSQLQRMMDALDPSMARPLPEDMQFMREGIDEIQELVEKQKALRDIVLGLIERMALRERQEFGTVLEPRENVLQEWNLAPLPPPTAPPQESRFVNTRDHREEQEALRFILGQLIREAAEHLGDVPENLGLAELEMRKSSASLGADDPSASIAPQNAAITYLEQARESMNQDLVARLRTMTGIPMGSGSRDPLGRPVQPQDGSTGDPSRDRIRIPDSGERRKVDEILKILRDRAGQRDRPEEELEYFRRLLRQF